jgi:hypothetical protein
MNTLVGLNLLDYLATGINKEDPTINAVFSNEKGEGAIANEFEGLYKFINYFTKTDNVQNHKGKTLESIVALFTKLQRRVNEDDSVLLRKMFSLTYRRGNTIWGNALNIKNVFEVYYNNIECYIAENTDKQNLLPDGEFASDDIWELDGGAVFDHDARFSNMNGLLFDGGNGERCTQVIEQYFNAGNYAFHFMLKGKCGVIIRREDGKYWNGNDQEFNGDEVLKWVDDEYINVFDEKDCWNDVFCFLVLPEYIYELTIEFVGIEGSTAYIDYARLFKLPLNPSFTIIIQFSGYAINEKTLHAGINGSEPIGGLNYEKESYFDSAFIIGLSNLVQSKYSNILLDIVRPCGIQPFLEFVEKREEDI